MIHFLFLQILFVFVAPLGLQSTLHPTDTGGLRAISGDLLLHLPGRTLVTKMGNASFSVSEGNLLQISPNNDSIRITPDSPFFCFSASGISGCFLSFTKDIFHSGNPWTPGLVVSMILLGVLVLRWGFRLAVAQFPHESNKIPGHATLDHEGITQIEQFLQQRQRDSEEIKGLLKYLLETVETNSAENTTSARLDFNEVETAHDQKIDPPEEIPLPTILLPQENTSRHFRTSLPEFPSGSEPPLSSSVSSAKYLWFPITPPTSVEIPRDLQVSTNHAPHLNPQSISSPSYENVGPRLNKLRVPPVRFYHHMSRKPQKNKRDASNTRRHSDQKHTAPSANLPIISVTPCSYKTSTERGAAHSPQRDVQLLTPPTTPPFPASTNGSSKSKETKSQINIESDQLLSLPNPFTTAATVSSRRYPRLQKVEEDIYLSLIQTTTSAPAPPPTPTTLKSQKHKELPTDQEIAHFGSGRTICTSTITLKEPSYYDAVYCSLSPEDQELHDEDEEKMVSRLRMEFDDLETEAEYDSEAEWEEENSGLARQIVPYSLRRR